MVKFAGGLGTAGAGGGAGADEGAAGAPGCITLGCIAGWNCAGGGVP
jgi:hypothetical protein